MTKVTFHGSNLYIGDTVHFFEIPDGVYYFEVKSEGYKTGISSAPFAFKYDGSKEKDVLPWITYLEKDDINQYIFLAVFVLFLSGWTLYEQKSNLPGYDKKTPEGKIKMKKIMKSALSILLVLCLMFESLPTYIWAEQPDATISGLEESGEHYYSEYTANDVIAEIKEQRTETEKHFLMNDGCNLAVSYAYPVHYLDKKGVYQDIDNSLVLYNANGTVSNRAADARITAYLETLNQGLAAADPVDSRFYGNKNGKAEIRFAVLSNAEPLATISYSGYTVSLTPQNTKKQIRAMASGADVEVPVAGRLEKLKDTAKLNSLETVILPESTASLVTYDGLFGNADLAYTADGFSFKENIIINSRADSYAYSFTLDTDGLNPHVMESGCIELRDADDQCVFYLVAGNMTDSAGAKSDLVKYSLDKNGDGTYTITILADKEWINDSKRSFPITLDPPVTINGFFNIETGSIFQWLPNETGGQRSVESLGWFNGSYGRILVRVNTLPSLPHNSCIVYSSINLYECAYSNVGMSAMDIEAHALLTNTPTTQGNEQYWCLYHTWNNCPALSGTVTDFVNINSTYQFRSFDVTREAIKWYKNASSNYGLCLKAAKEGQMSSSNCANTHFTSSNLANGSARPYFVVVYRNNIGLEDYYSYQTQDIRRAGTGYIGDYSGQLTIVKPDVSFASTVNPIEISHIYNSAYYNGNYEVIPNSGGLYANTKVGIGWKLNIQQSITAVGNSLAYIDADGTVHYFNPDGNVYRDEDGLGLTVTGSNGSYTMSDQKGNTKEFVGGMLKRMTDTNNNKIEIEFSGSRITGVKRQNNGGALELVAYFYYNNNGYLSSIYDFAGRTTSFVYNTPHLTDIVHPDGTRAFYGYTYGKLGAAADYDSYYILFYEYGTGGRVSRFYEGSNCIGADVLAADENGVQVYRYNGIDREFYTNDDLISRYVFDYFGRTITSFVSNASENVIYGATAARYNNNVGVAKTNNRLRAASAVGMRPIGNTGDYDFISQNLLGSDDTSGTTGWSTGTRQADSRFGYAIKVNGAIGESREVAKTIACPAGEDWSGKTFTLSAWARADSVALSDSSRTYKLKATLYYSNNTTEEHEVSYCADSPDWQYNNLPLVPQNSELGINQIKVSFRFDNNPNMAYFTHPCLTIDTAQSYTYNADGNLTSVRTPGNENMSYSYSGADLISQVTQGNGTFTYTYNNAHNVTKVENDSLSMNVTRDAMGNATATELSGTGTTDIINSSAVFTANGNLLERQFDARGNNTFYGYAYMECMTGTPQPTQVIDPRGNSTLYSYNLLNNRITGAQILNEVSLSYGYTDGMLSTLTRTIDNNNSQRYALTYDNFDNLHEVKIVSTSNPEQNSRTLASYNYGTENNMLQWMSYGNGFSQQYAYDTLERVIEIKYNNSSTNKLSYEYYGEGSLKSMTDGLNGRSYGYQYDTLGRLLALTEKFGVNTVQQYAANYDTANRATSFTYQISPNWSGTLGTARSYSFDYSDTDGSLEELTAPGGSIQYSYDGLKRLSSRTTKNSSGTTLYTRTYGYLAGSGTNVSTTLVSLLNNGDFGSYSYEYDANGNITKITSGSNETNYSYDVQNRLTSETHGQTTYYYSYDGAGNLLSKTKTTGSGTDSYTYGDSTWKDLLTAYNGEDITYDAIGNPTEWYDGSAMSWANGRRLATISSVSNNNYQHDALAFTYDADGLRLTKTVGTGNSAVEHRYLWQGGRLISESWGNNTLEFFYDESGSPFALSYNGTIYYYITNLQGDVVKIVNASGSSVAEYSYNAWGEVLTATGTLASVNPLRYRGYYYDSESGFYYLKSRYYDPEICRWINADDASNLGANSDFASVNLFAYCGNNPVNRADDGGEFWHFVAGAVVGGIIGAISSVVGQAASGQSINWAEVGVSAASGALTGAITAACPGMSAVATGIVHGVVGAGTYAATELVNGRTPSAIGIVTAGLTSGLLAGGAKALSNRLTTTKLYRSVGPHEAESFSNTGRFSAGNGSMEGKFFATSRANAQEWGAKLGANNIISIRVPNSALTDSSVTYFLRLDGIGPAYYFADLDFLNSVVLR